MRQTCLSHNLNLLAMCLKAINVLYEGGGEMLPSRRIKTLTVEAVSSIADTINVTIDSRDLLARVVRGWSIYAEHGHSIRDLNGTSLVPSQSKSGAFYIVVGNTCTCPDYVKRRARCKHMLALQIKHAAAAAAPQTRAIQDII